MAIFDWTKQKSEITETTKIQTRYPVSHDWTESYSVNKALTYGIYHNTYPGLKLAGSLAFPPIAVPVWFMGVPIFKAVNENQQAIIDDLVKNLNSYFEQIHTQAHREGTIWVFPKFNSLSMVPVWEFISDDGVTILKDIISNEPIKIIVDEEITVSTGTDSTATVRRTRTYTKEKIEVKHSLVNGTVSVDKLDKTMRNVAGILPIAFSNNADGDEVRGHSDYERFLPDLKMYHDLTAQVMKQLAKFNIKMVQNSDEPDAFITRLLATNGWSSPSEIDISKLDFIVGKSTDKTDFVFPSGAFESIFTKLSILYKKIVESSGVPEICWGLKTQGNVASVEESMSGLMRYCMNKQVQKTDKYAQLMAATLRLMTYENIDFTVSWNDLDNVSYETRAKIFQMYASGISSLVSGAAISKEQLYKLWKSLYPKITEEDIKQFNINLSATAEHKQYSELAYDAARDFRQASDTE